MCTSQLYDQARRVEEVEHVVADLARIDVRVEEMQASFYGEVERLDGEVERLDGEVTRLDGRLAGHSIELEAQARELAHFRDILGVSAHDHLSDAAATAAMLTSAVSEPVLAAAAAAAAVDPDAAAEDEMSHEIMDELAEPELAADAAADGTAAIDDDDDERRRSLARRVEMLRGMAATRAHTAHVLAKTKPTKQRGVEASDVGMWEQTHAQSTLERPALEQLATEAAASPAPEDETTVTTELEEPEEAKPQGGEELGGQPGEVEEMEEVEMVEPLQTMEAAVEEEPDDVEDAEEEEEEIQEAAVEVSGARLIAAQEVESDDDDLQIISPPARTPPTVVDLDDMATPPRPTDEQVAAEAEHEAEAAAHHQAKLASGLAEYRLQAIETNKREIELAVYCLAMRNKFDEVGYDGMAEEEVAASSDFEEVDRGREYLEMAGRLQAAWQRRRVCNARRQLIRQRMQKLAIVPTLQAQLAAALATIAEMEAEMEAVAPPPPPEPATAATG